MLKKSIEKVKEVTKSKPRTVAELGRDAKQLKRLERLIDVIFAILIWSIFQNLPIPSAEEFARLSNVEIFNEYKNSFIMIFIGMFLIITYWGQNNRTFGNLVRTDSTHSVLSFMQLIFLLLYIYYCFYYHQALAFHFFISSKYCSCFIRLLWSDGLELC